MPAPCGGPPGLRCTIGYCVSAIGDAERQRRQGGDRIRAHARVGRNRADRAWPTAGRNRVRPALQSHCRMTVVSQT